MESKIKIGWSEVDISPKEKIFVSGQFYERISDVIETPITVTALAIECDGEQAVICSCDIACIKSELVDKVREFVSGKVNDLDVSKIILCATHTHTSYEYAYRNEPSKVSTVEILKRYIPEGRKYVKHVSGDAMHPFDACTTLILPKS